MPLQLFRIVLMVILVFGANCFGQQLDFIKGKVLDSNTKEPVVFATLRIKNKAVGVISNMDGTFKIPERLNIYGDTLEISSMGFRNLEVLISTLSLDDSNIIYLPPSVEVLEEVVVKADRKRKERISTRNIVRRALENIRKNYPLDPFSLIGYYRDYQLQGGKYINLNEAILEVFDDGFLKSDFTNTKVSIYDYKENTSFERDTLADDMYDYENMRKIVDNAFLFNYGGNEFTLLRVHDAIRNYNINSFSFINRLDEDLIGHHNFDRYETTSLREETIYRIPFTRRNSDYRVFGTLYISPGDYAIHKMEYAVYDIRERKPKDILNKHNTAGQLVFEIITEYQRHNGKMYLNFISFHNQFQLLMPPEFLVEEVILDAAKKRFEVRFNKEPEERNSLRNGNYRFKFEDRKIKFDRMELFEKIVFLYPKLESPSDIEAFKRLSDLVLYEKKNKEFLKVKIDKVKDKQGNVLNQGYYKGFDQYREFFVQQVKPNSSPLDTMLFMDKLKPIYKDQPIVRPDNFNDYWMNTPFKALE